MARASRSDASASSTALCSFPIPSVRAAGKATTAAVQIAAWKAGFTPTVLFLGPQGQEIAERLVGLGSNDFYGAYLDDRLATARKVLAR